MYMRTNVSLEAKKIVLDLEEDNIAVIRIYQTSMFSPVEIYLHRMDDKQMEWFTGIEPKDTYTLMEQVDVQDDTTE